jgi:hypothetical protein
LRKKAPIVCWENAELVGLRDVARKEIILSCIKVQTGDC